MNTSHVWLESSVTRWTAIGVSFVVLTALLAAVVPELGRQTYSGRSEMRQPAIVTLMARDRPAIDQKGTADTSVPSAQAVFEHSPVVSEDLPATF